MKPPEFTADDVELTGPFRAVGAVTNWHFVGEAETPVGDYLAEFPAEKYPLSYLVNEGGIGIYCISNRCRTRYLTHPSNKPTLAAAIFGVGNARNGYRPGLVTFEKPRRTSSKRLSKESNVTAYGPSLRRWADLDDPGGAEFACPRCRSSGCATTKMRGTM